METIKNRKITINGLGYFGLPLAVEFSKNGFSVIGFDIDEKRKNELKKGKNHPLEVSEDVLKKDLNLTFSTSLKEIEKADIYIITVPTPIGQYKKPYLTPLIEASQSIGALLVNGNIVFFESAVLPGCTEEICVPILEKNSGLIYNVDFSFGYSPESINPRDSIRKADNIVKITSSSTIEVFNIVDDLYNSIVTVGTYKAPSIKVAEEGKIIENTRLDVNISLMNELALIFDRLDIDRMEVLEAAEPN